MDKTTAQQCRVQQFETDPRQELENFLLKFLDLIIHHEVPKLKLFSQQPKVQQFESTGFQDPQAAAAETSGNYYYSSDGKSRGVVASRASGGRGNEGGGGKIGKNFSRQEIYTKFFGGKIFFCRAYFSSMNSQFTRKILNVCRTHPKYRRVIVGGSYTPRMLACDTSRLAGKNLRDLRVPPRSS